MTLPEVTISVVITGIVVATMSMATTVILRQMDNTEGRTNNARSEQNVGMFMPTDLSSAESVNTEATAVPCGPTPACPAGADISGSNALMLTWTGSVFDPVTSSVVSTRTVVSYRVVQVDGEFRLNRVECYSINGAAPSCETKVVLRDLEPPPAGTTWIPGTTPPSWIMTVSQAASADDISGPGDTLPVVDPGLKNKNAQRVVVTINGGGDAAGAGGGQNQISLSAGGTNRETNLTTDDLAGAPTFTAARSRCGGNFGVIVDKSGSIGGNMGTVRNGVNGFIETFSGTPVKLQVVTFSAQSQTLGAGAGWSKYYDMLIESDVTALKGLVNGISSNGGTNWEDGFFRMLRNSDGTVQAQLPNTIIFFTDGIPTRSRIDETSASAAVVLDPTDNNLPASDGSNFSQIAWNRTERLIRDRGSINLVGVYVNDSLTADSDWIIPGAGYHWLYEQSNDIVYEQSSTVYERANTVRFQVSIDSDMTFQRRNHATSWTFPAPTTVSWNTYKASNLDNTQGDGWRTKINGDLSTGGSSWMDITQAEYDKSNVNYNYTDGFRTRVASGSMSPWTTVTQAEFTASNTSGMGESDGWRTSLVWTPISQTAYTAGNTTADSSDGFRSSNPGGTGGWSEVTQAVYNANNSSGSESDGWRATQVFALPYDQYLPSTTKNILNYATIGNLVINNTSGNDTPAAFVEALPRGGPYTNAAVADLFVLPNYANFSSALSAIALGECGGTVTMQTRVGSAAAQDPFTYENTSTHEVVQTSAAYRSGTFDIALPGGDTSTVTISPQDFTNLSNYQPAGWACKSAGVAYPFTVVPVPDHAPWTAIQLTVNPNQAVSCIQQVTYT